ncbi:MAG TPA: hypothetical protein VNB22_00515 [Pyrinomonadaceae bacterium]|nr:hypothetical protein [Pyrinomonadaceae bacterium]
MQNLSLKKIFLYLLIASVAFSALLGIGVILFGNFGEFETKILMTASTVTITSILGLACGAYLETGRGKILPVSGIILAVISAVVWIILIWNSSNQGKVFAKILMTVTLFAAACSLLSLLSIAELDKKFRWSLSAAHLAVWSLTAFLFYLIWVENDFAGEFIPRTIGVLSIVIAALTIITPVFHWLSKQTPQAEEIDAEIARLRARIEELEKQRGEIPNNEN